MSLELWSIKFASRATRGRDFSQKGELTRRGFNATYPNDTHTHTERKEKNANLFKILQIAISL